MSGGVLDFTCSTMSVEMNVDAYLDPKYGIYDYLMEQKRNGRIKHLGFSAHGDIECMTKFFRSIRKRHGILSDRAELF